jgi:leucyl aminopeptidase
MKSVYAVLSFVCVALAIPFFSTGDNVQVPVVLEEHTNFPGFDLDLNELRLVQLEGQDPVWMTELDKVLSITLIWHLIATVRQIKIKAQGLRFFDM